MLIRHDFYMFARLFTLLLSLFSYAEYKVDLFYTSFIITDPCVESIVTSKAFQRLYGIAQYGIDPKVIPLREHTKIYNRANHSLGVYWLLNRYNVPTCEQLAGLLHDASHTVFSHVGDRVFNHKDGNYSYQDMHHLTFLNETDIPFNLKTHGFSLEDIDHKNPLFTCLEQNLPDICADRLEYNLAGGFLENLLTIDDIFAILDHLKFEDNRWYFTDSFYAQKFARVSLWHTEHIWGAPMSSYVSEELADAIKKAVALGILTLEEIKHGTDDHVWKKLQECNNAEINNHLQTLYHAAEQHEVINKKPRNNKFRGINPWVKQGHEFKRLTEIDAAFKQEYERVKENSY